MRVYGWDDTGVARGEMMAAEVSAGQAYVAAYGPASVAPPDWEMAFTRFREAQRRLVALMRAADADPDAVRLVRELKAADVPEVEA